MEELVWLSKELVQRIHIRQILEHGGISGVRDESLLEFVLARPRQKWNWSKSATDLPALAAAYATGISHDHPFPDGNKRTAAIACELLLELNGYFLSAEDVELYPLYSVLLAGEINEDEFAARLRDYGHLGHISKSAAI